MLRYFQLCSFCVSIFGDESGIENKTQNKKKKKNPAIKHLVKPEGNPKNPIVKTEIGKTFLANLSSDIKFKEHTYTLYESITFQETRDGYSKICIRVTPKHRTSWVIFYKPKKGVSERTYKIANCEDISRDKAVELAKEVREAISEGLHPEDARRQKKTAVGPTLKECMEDKIQSRGLRPHRRKGLAASTVESYRKLMNIVDDYGLANIPMTAITSQKIRLFDVVCGICLLSWARIGTPQRQ
ncbi:integrase arm-type DNA-binding domain-containing protein [Halomonas sp. QHL1]|uniref:integrase arm-type DNA-binding domain-containing protein n=1 Tax=Halomonas sp. QHL1 TaxID=1123773 RepID=UPI0008FD3B1C|nr:integrase arm-type DNA-binding domain-containing protein [Halomonas sp. QHL1]OJA05001.1 hypothetical protein QHL1GM_06135 [Halomonas sp. QHL1]